jgi:hypothetical protein
MPTHNKKIILVLFWRSIIQFVLVYARMPLRHTIFFSLCHCAIQLIFILCQNAMKFIYSWIWVPSYYMHTCMHTCTHTDVGLWHTQDCCIHNAYVRVLHTYMHTYMIHTYIIHTYTGLQHTQRLCPGTVNRKCRVLR